MVSMNFKKLLNDPIKLQPKDLEKYAQISNRQKIERKDFGIPSLDGFTPFGPKELLPFHEQHRK